MGSLSDWEMIMKHQRKNGSLFNLPSTSAAALTHLQNAGYLRYLKLVLEKFGDAENLERLDISCHFRKEIIDTLDDTYRCWLQARKRYFWMLPPLQWHLGYCDPMDMMSLQMH